MEIKISEFYCWNLAMLSFYDFLMQFMAMGVLCDEDEIANPDYSISQNQNFPIFAHKKLSSMSRSKINEVTLSIENECIRVAHIIGLNTVSHPAFQRDIAFAIVEHARSIHNVSPLNRGILRSYLRVVISTPEYLYTQMLHLISSIALDPQHNEPPPPTERKVELFQAPEVPVMAAMDQVVKQRTSIKPPVIPPKKSITNLERLIKTKNDLKCVVKPNNILRSIEERPQHSELSPGKKISFIPNIELRDRHQTTSFDSGSVRRFRLSRKIVPEKEARLSLQRQPIDLAKSLKLRLGDVKTQDNGDSSMNESTSTSRLSSRFSFKPFRRNEDKDSSIKLIPRRPAFRDSTTGKTREYSSGMNKSFTAGRITVLRSRVTPSPN